MKLGNWFEMSDEGLWGSIAVVCTAFILIFCVGPCTQNQDTLRMRQTQNDTLLQNQGFRKLEDGTWVKPIEMERK